MCLPLVQGNAVTRNVHSCTLTRSQRSKTVPGMTEASVNTVCAPHSCCSVAGDQGGSVAVPSLHDVLVDVLGSAGIWVYGM